MSEQGLAVEAAGLTKVFAVKGGSGVTALDALDLSLREGELTALVQAEFLHGVGDLHAGFKVVAGQAFKAVGPEVLRIQDQQTVIVQ